MTATVAPVVDHSDIGTTVVLVRDLRIPLRIILDAWAILNDAQPASLAEAIRYVLDPRSQDHQPQSAWFDLISDAPVPTWERIIRENQPGVPWVRHIWFTETDVNLAVATIVCGQVLAAQRFLDIYREAQPPAHGRDLDNLVAANFPHRVKLDRIDLSQIGSDVTHPASADR